MLSMKNMIRTFCAGIVISSVCMTNSFVVEAAGHNQLETKQIFINHEAINLSVIYQNDFHLVPASLFRQMGVGIEWDNQAKSVSLTKNDNKVKLTAGIHTAYYQLANDEDWNTDKDLATRTTLINGISYVPLAYTAQKLGIHVEYDAKLKAAKLLVDVTSSQDSENNTTNEQVAPSITENNTTNEQVAPSITENNTTNEQVAPSTTENNTIIEQVAPSINQNSTTIEQVAPTVNQNNTANEQVNPIVETSKFSEKDIYWLYRITEAEAGGESYKGKVAVAATILNRVDSEGWPNTVVDTIFEVVYVNGKAYYQFEPVLNNYIYEVTPSADTMKAVQAAIDGEDPTNGAVVFYNPTKTSNKWILSRHILVTIGNHVFAS